MQEHYIKVGEINTHYYEAGQGEPLLLIHGGGAGADAWGNWKGCLPRLAEQFRVLAVDMVGFGKTDKPDPSTFEYSQEARVQHIIAFIEALGLENVNLVGNSMGGATALGVCMRRPDLVGKLVLMGSAGLKFEPTEALRVIMGYAPTRENMEKLVRTLTHEEFEIDSELIDYRYNLTLQPGVMEAYQAMGRWIAEHGLFYLDEEIRQVRQETLIINGKQDKVVPAEVAWRFSQLIELSWLCLIPHCGHWVMIERRDEFCALTSWFLAHA
jgi:2-hydroxy-6-oxo-6-(2'-aminophenyl)hexa-2,4-dienoate hydrolase